MSWVPDILRKYIAPGWVLRQRIGIAKREDRALATLMAACILMFVAQWPRLSNEAVVDPNISIEARLAGALFGWMLLAPLAMYILASISQTFLRLLGGKASGYDARMALFWALLAAAPIWLLSGLVYGFVGHSAVSTVASAIALVVFLVIWAGTLAEIVRFTKSGVG
ncbi:MAG: YIP1 family protein [Boseongicola sp.]